jgi:spore coat polysaccharide biosynthesis predicted glycosyltransferase SpsG
VIDDNGQAACPADILLNHNIHAVASMYPDSRAKLLLGCHYALIRREFHSRVTRTRTSGTHLLVTMGGSDPVNATEKVLRVLLADDFHDVIVTAVAGPANPHLEQLKRLVDSDPSHRVTIVLTPDMPTLLADIDMAISNAGVTCMELAFMGIPALLVVTADNQANAAPIWDRLGSAINLGWHEEVTESKICETTLRLLRAADLRKQLAMRGRELVGGNGPQIIVDEMTRTGEKSERGAGR